MLDDCENHSASCCEIRLEPSPILTKVSAAGVGTTPGEGPETQRTHYRPGAATSRHPGHHRPLIPTAEVNVLKVLLPERCQHCGRKLPQKADRVTTEGEPRRHQVTEIPEINPHTTEYQCPQVVCEHGQKTTQEPLPE